MPRKDLIPLKVSQEQKAEDQREGIIYFKPGASNQTKRLIFINGAWRTNTEQGVFDTTNYSSHGKKGYAAVTMDLNYNMRVFSHYFTEDKIAHSSMLAGAPPCLRER